MSPIPALLPLTLQFCSPSPSCLPKDLKTPAEDDVGAIAIGTAILLCSV